VTPDPGRVLRLALAGWGIGHIALGRHAIGRALLLGELLGLGLVAWLTIGLADTSAYLVPFVAGTGFIVAWAWQAIDAYRAAREVSAARAPVPERSAAAAIGWLSLPLLLWGTGFWLIAAHSASPAAVLDRFVTEWAGDELGGEWTTAVRRNARAAAAPLGGDADRFQDIRVRITHHDDRGATAVAEAIHFEARDATFLGVFPGSELVPVADRQVLTFDLVARPIELPGGGDIGAVRWELATARLP
jgi:hypothetical protein